MPKHSIFLSFGFAAKGLAFAMKERNFIIHLLSAAIVVFLGFFFSVSTTEWNILLICSGMVISAELFNTAIEKLVDLVSPQTQPKAGEIKDMAAAAVLVLAIVSAIIGCVIFIPYVSEML